MTRYVSHPHPHPHPHLYPHQVSVALSSEECERLCGLLHMQRTESGVLAVLSALCTHADAEHVRALVDTLALWVVLGAGCTVVSQSPAKLGGAIPQHLETMWQRVPSLIESGLLSYDARGRGTFHPLTGMQRSWSRFPPTQTSQD